MTRLAAFVLLVFLITNTVQAADPAASADAEKLKQVLTGDNEGAAADNPRCKLFTPAEVAEYIGVPVRAGRNAALGMGCQWVATVGEGDVIVAVVPARYHETPSLAKGFRKLADIGSKGFVVPELGGWAAGAIAGDEAVRVSVAGPKANEASAIALLKEALKRHHS